MQKISIIVILLFMGVLSHAQNVYPTVLEGCDTSRFSLESEQPTAILEDRLLRDFIIQHLGLEDGKRLRGELKLQIIVYKQGKSCLLSFDNQTNRKELNIEQLKKAINSSLVWHNDVENVAALIELNFKRKRTTLKRMGMDGNRGWHELAH